MHRKINPRVRVFPQRHAPSWISPCPYLWAGPCLENSVEGVGQDCSIIRHAALGALRARASRIAAASRGLIALWGSLTVKKCKKIIKPLSPCPGARAGQTLHILIIRPTDSWTRPSFLMWFVCVCFRHNPLLSASDRRPSCASLMHW